MERGRDINENDTPIVLTALARLDRVVDGDTIVVTDLEVTRRTDEGSDTIYLHWPVAIRLLDCWAPEARTPEGVESTLSLRRAIGIGDRVFLKAITDKVDTIGDLFSFGRVLAKAYREYDMLDLAAYQVENGHATKAKT